ncbi:MAG: protocatechuate 3,4-dioxygenase [Candidatus Hydrogenedentes bacterium]|nr:protocatechuate 3,4-dioxygenase [Candidatus Hydrogenedentota bacterium]
MHISRRRFLNGIAGATALFTVPGAFAEELLRTPPQTAGPFYPNKLPLDTDNDLLVINSDITPAVGEITHLGGRILDARGNPVRNALVEIWQVDNNGVYIHEGSVNSGKRDANFQGFGRFLTGSSGEYYFRTIKPVPYGDASFLRTRHIHYAVHTKGRERFTTQCYVKGEPLNENDSVLKSIRDPKLRELVTVDFAPLPESPTHDLAATFDIILDVTPSA